MRYYASVVVVLIVAGCAPVVPDSNPGVGFDDYQNYQEAREAELAGAATIKLGAEISDEVVAAGADEVSAPATPAATPAPATPAEPITHPAPSAPITPLAPVTTIAAEPVAEPVQLNRGNAGISDEQDFEAVSGRETIESDAARRAAQQQAYQVIAPTALPTRQGRQGANIVEFALATTNLVGQPVFRRPSVLAGNRFQRNCAKYPSSDLAQQAFLQNGGPQRDRQGIDPDGDGFACFWDPAPFRQAVRN